MRKIGEMKASFADENLDMSAFKTSLEPWIERDKAKGLEYPTLNWKKLPEVVDMLLQRRNRVWARIFIQELSHFAVLKPELLEWAQHLNSQGEMHVPLSTAVLLSVFQQRCVLMMVAFVLPRSEISQDIH